MRNHVVTFQRPDRTCHEAIVKASCCTPKEDDEDTVVVLDDQGSEVAIPGMERGDRIINFRPQPVFQ